MTNKKDTNNVEQTATDIRDYVMLQFNKLKLRLLDGLSTMLNGIFSVFIIIIVAAFALIFLSAGVTLALAEWINSMLGAIFIMFGVFFIATIVLYICRKRLLTNSIVRMLAKILFETDKDLDNE